MQPQLAQSGAPPNWHGVIFVVEVGRDASSSSARRRNRRARRAARRRPRSAPSAAPASDSCSRSAMQIGDDALRDPPARRRSSDDLADLRRVEAEPDLLDLGSRRPELQELLEVARPVHLLPRDRAVHGDAMSRDVLQDAIVGRRRAPRRRARAAGRRSRRRSTAVACRATRPGSRARRSSRAARGCRAWRASAGSCSARDSAPAARRRRSTRAAAGVDRRARGRRRSAPGL